MLGGLEPQVNAGGPHVLSHAVLYKHPPRRVAPPAAFPRVAGTSAAGGHHVEVGQLVDVRPDVAKMHATPINMAIQST